VGTFVRLLYSAEDALAQAYDALGASAPDPLARRCRDAAVLCRQHLVALRPSVSLYGGRVGLAAPADETPGPGRPALDLEDIFLMSSVANLSWLVACAAAVRLGDDRLEATADYCQPQTRQQLMWLLHQLHHEDPIPGDEPDGPADAGGPTVLGGR